MQETKTPTAYCLSRTNIIPVVFLTPCRRRGDILAHMVLEHMVPEYFNRSSHAANCLIAVGTASVGAVPWKPRLGG